MKQFIKVVSVADFGSPKTELINRQQIVSLNVSDRVITMSNGENYRVPKKLWGEVLSELNIIQPEPCQK